MKEFVTTKIELDINRNEINRYVYKVYTINEKGHPYDETEFDSDGEAVCNRMFRYFETGEIESYVEYSSIDELLERQVYIKNDEGEIYKIEKEYSGGNKIIREFSYSDLGNADTAIIKNEDGEITGYEAYIFGENGEIKEEIEFDSDNNEILKVSKSYTNSGLEESEITYTDGVLYNEIYYEYDAKGNLCKKVFKNILENFGVIDLYEYDDEGNMIYISSHRNGFLVFESKSAYNRNNELESEEYFELDYWSKEIIKHERLIHEIKE